MNENNFFRTSLSFKDYLANTFMATGLGVAISMVVSFVLSINPYFIFKYSGLFMLSALAELGVAFFFSFKLRTMSRNAAWICYILYSVLTGISLTSIFYVYSYSSITAAFVSTLILFICMAVIGKTTKVDMTRFSGILMSGLLAIIISSFINTFIFKSTGVELVISYLGIVIFLGLIAYDMQQLQRFYNEGAYDYEMNEKMMIFGAFQLYLDFINLFLRVLRFMGRSRSRN